MDINKVKAFVIRLRKMVKEKERDIKFCDEHKFNVEALVKTKEVEIIKNIILQMEYDLGLDFIWDKSLDE
jgi:hypothetical protein